MTAAQFFQIATWLAMAFWALLFVAPRWKGTQLTVHSGLAPALLSVLYVLALALAGPSPEGGGFGSLEEVQLLFSSPWVMCAGWVHYLAFDLFVGAWISRDAVRHQVRHLWMLPLLLMTFWLGPAGLLSYLAFRQIKGRYSPSSAGSPAPK